MTDNISDRFIDLEFYAEANPELAVAGLDTSEELRQHLLEFGVEEGRVFSPFVDLEFYANSYQDLAANGITEPSELLTHIEIYGLEEGRRIAPTVDLMYYAENNPELQTVLANDFEEYFDHLRNFGVAEGRTFQRLVDLEGYLEQNPDVNAEVGGSLEDALEHMLLSGIEEELPGALESLSADSLQIQAPQQLYEFLGVGNIPGVAALNSPDTVWDFAGDRSRVAFTGTWFGREGIQQWAQTLGTVLQINRFDRLEYVQNGDRVGVRIVEEGQPIFSEIPYKDDLTQLWTVGTDGQIYSLESIYNTYAFNQAYAGVTPNPEIPNDIAGEPPPPIDENANEAATLQVAEGFWNAVATGGDVTNLLAPDVIWSNGSSGDRNLLPHTGLFQGPEGVVDSLTQFGNLVERGDLSVVESFVDGNRALVRVREDDATVRSNGIEFDQDILSWITVENGQISEVQNVVDNNLVVQALFPGDSYPLPPTIGPTGEDFGLAASQLSARAEPESNDNFV